MTYHARITSKGQVTLPVGLRRQLNLQTGDEISFVENEDGSYRLLTNALSFKNLHGFVQLDGNKPTHADIEQAREKARCKLAMNYLRVPEPAE